MIAVVILLSGHNTLVLAKFHSGPIIYTVTPAGRPTRVINQLFIITEGQDIYADRVFWPSRIYVLFKI